MNYLVYDRAKEVNSVVMELIVHEFKVMFPCTKEHVSVFELFVG